MSAPMKLSLLSVSPGETSMKLGLLFDGDVSRTA